MLRHTLCLSSFVNLRTRRKTVKIYRTWMSTCVVYYDMITKVIYTYGRKFNAVWNSITLTVSVNSGHRILLQ